MSKKPLNISEEAAVQMPMKTVASLIALVAIGTWAYFGLHETLNRHSTQIELMQKDLEITSKSQFWTQSMQNSTKTLHSDMSGRSVGSWGTVEV